MKIASSVKTHKNAHYVKKAWVLEAHKELLLRDEPCFSSEKDDLLAVQLKRCSNPPDSLNTASTQADPPTGALRYQEGGQGLGHLHSWPEIYAEERTPRRIGGLNLRSVSLFVSEKAVLCRLSFPDWSTCELFVVSAVLKNDSSDFSSHAFFAICIVLVYMGLFFFMLRIQS